MIFATMQKAGKLVSFWKIKKNSKIQQFFKYSSKTSYFVIEYLCQKLKSPRRCFSLFIKDPGLNFLTKNRGKNSWHCPFKDLSRQNNTLVKIVLKSIQWTNRSVERDTRSWSPHRWLGRDTRSLSAHISMTGKGLWNSYCTYSKRVGIDSERWSHAEEIFGRWSSHKNTLHLYIIMLKPKKH